MSVLIRVEKMKSVQVSAILPKIGKALSYILGLRFEPELVATEMYKFEEVLPKSYCIEAGTAALGIKVKDEQAGVSVFSHKGVQNIVVSPDCWRTELEGALAVATAIALAEYSETEISDSGLTFTETFIQTAGEFAEAVRVDKTFDDINEAAQAFYARLYSNNNQ